jgi:hypothetical protein
MGDLIELFTNSSVDDWVLMTVHVTPQATDCIDKCVALYVCENTAYGTFDN